MAQIYTDGLIKKKPDGAYEVVSDIHERTELKNRRSKPKRRDNIDPAYYEDPSLDLDLQEGDLE